MKKLFVLMLILLLACMLTSALDTQPVKAEPRTWTVDDDGPADFHSIQEAINTASSGDTIRVKAGTYYENLGVSKSITLLGESPTTTIINATWGEPVDIRVTVFLGADNVYLSGFTIHAHQDASAIGILIDGYYNTVANNRISNHGVGVYIRERGFNYVIGNTISNNYYGIWMHLVWFFEVNFVVGNFIVNNNYGIIMTPAWSVFYHNNIINNEYQVLAPHSFWDNGYPSGGNYWSDYTGVDLYKGPYQNITGSDGIGDTPYVIGGYPPHHQDNYPLMKPWTPQNAISKLIRDIEDMNLQQGIDNSLDAKLTVALDALETLNADQRSDAIQKLYAFINEVEAQREKKLTNEQADYLIVAAQEILGLIS